MCTHIWKVDTCICIFLYIIFLYTHACVKSKGLFWCKKINNKKRTVLYRMTWMFKNNTKETFQVFWFFSFWNKWQVTYISPLFEGMELKTAWYFFAKRKDRKRKRTSHRLFIDTVINLSQPQLMHSEVACAFLGIGRAGPPDPILCFPHPHGRDWREYPFLHCTAASFGIMCHSLILQVTSVLYIRPLSSGQWFKLDGHLEF